MKHLNKISALALVACSGGACTGSSSMTTGLLTTGAVAGAGLGFTIGQAHDAGVAGAIAGGIIGAAVGGAIGSSITQKDNKNYFDKSEPATRVRQPFED